MSQSLDSQGDVLTVKQVADILQCSTNQVYDLINKGIVPGIRLGWSWRVSTKALRKIIENGSVTR